MNVRYIGVTLMTSLTLTACSLPQEAIPFLEQAGSAQEPLTGTVTIEARDYQFHPNTVTIRQGTAIELINRDQVGHSLLTDDKSVRTEILGANESTVITFDNVGGYRFSSEPYPNMVGTITVVAP